MNAEFHWDKIHLTALAAARSKFFQALDSLSKDERRQLHISHGEIHAPPRIKDKLRRLQGE